MFFTSIPMPNHHLFFLNSMLYQKPINKVIKKRSIFLPLLIVANIRIHYIDLMLQSQLTKGNNGLVKKKYITFGIEADSLRTAKPKLERMVRVKITGEVTEVDRKVMRILRAEEKRLRRSKQGVPISGTEGKTAEERASVLSLSYVSYEGCEDLEPYWLIDSSSMEESVMFWMSEKEFRATLTPKQLDIYLNCIIGGQSKIDYAAANNMQRQSVYNAATLIMKKAKYFFKKF